MVKDLDKIVFAEVSLHSNQIILVEGDDIYIMMKCLSVCLSVCHEKWSLPLKVCDFLSENV